MLIRELSALFVGMFMNSRSRLVLLAWGFVCTQRRSRMPARCWRAALDALQYLDLGLTFPC